MLNLLADALLSLLYPQRCRICSRDVERNSDGVACRGCWCSTKIFCQDDPLCAKCGVFLNGVSRQALSTCKLCDDHYYDKAQSAGLYEKALAASVLNLKTVPNVPSTVRKCLIDVFDQLECPTDFVVIPVPLSKQRLLERGFNQASLLAKLIADHSRQPLDEYSLIRESDTPMHRAAMDRKARDATVKNIFSVVRPKLVRNRNIMVVDDLMTSGATVSYCAKALKKSGAGRVYVITLARAA